MNIETGNQVKINKSLIIPIYQNEDNIPRLITTLELMFADVGGDLEVVFVVDGSPDSSRDLLLDAMATCTFPVQIIELSRNFGSFTAIRTGLKYTQGKVLAVMAADLQEPPELIEKFFDILEKDAADVVFGQREERNDPAIKKVFSSIYWHVYRKIVNSEIPRGGVDIFACNHKVKNAILSIEEPNSSLVAQLFWVGFRRCFVPYTRLARLEGTSAWSFRKRIRYMLDSIFSYSDYPIMLVLWIGLAGLVVSCLIGFITLISKLMGWISVPGYTALVLVILFFSSAILTTQGLVGCYLWRAFENTKRRPLSCVQDVKTNMQSNSVI